MAQSSLYAYGSQTAQTVDITNDDARDVGDVDVKSIQSAIDITSDGTRTLGETQVTNTVETLLAGALESRNNDTVLTQVTEAIEVADTSGTTIDPATETTLSLIADTLEGRGAEVVKTEQQTPVGIEDSGGTQVNPATASDITGLTNEVQSLITQVQDRLTNHPNLLFGHAQVTTAGTPVSLTGGTSEPIPPEQDVLIQGIPGNSGTVYIGDGSVSNSNGYPLVAGQVISLGIDDAATLHVDADNANDQVAYIAEVA